jgi:hypothetical protein
LEIACTHKSKKKTSSTGRGQSTASDKSSNDLFSLMTTWNTSSDLKKQGIDVDQVILERMATVHISQEFTPEAFHIKFRATMEEEEDAGIPLWRQICLPLSTKGNLKSLPWRSICTTSYHGDPNKIHEFALQDAIPMNLVEMIPLARKMLAYNSWHNTSRKVKRFPKSICSDLDTQMSHPRARPMKEWTRC